MFLVCSLRSWLRHVQSLVFLFQTATFPFHCFPHGVTLGTEPAASYFHFVNCFFQKVMKSGSLNVVGELENYMLANSSSCLPNEEVHLLEGFVFLPNYRKWQSIFYTRSWSEVRSVSLKISLVPVNCCRSVQLEPEVSSVCLEIIIRGHIFSAFYLFGQLPVVLVECG